MILVLFNDKVLEIFLEKYSIKRAIIFFPKVGFGCTFTFLLISPSDFGARSRCSIEFKRNSYIQIKP